VTLLGGTYRGKPAQDQGDQVCGLLLAAGRGSRFGAGKLHALYRGVPLLTHSLSLLQAAVDRGWIETALVVLPPVDEQGIRMASDAGVPVILNDAPHAGLSRSLRLGLQELEERTRAAAAMIFLADQPLVRLDVVEALVAVWHRQRRSVIRPRYASHPNVPGHPVLLARGVWSRTRGLTGDVGFSGLPAQDCEEVLLIDVPGDNPDIDTSADLERLHGASQ
jgi:molybdenum cofactor cytidylyltransferase